jgi:hypothetical protein
VDEAQWAASTNPETLLDFLRDSGKGGRKLRLFAAACCRRIWGLLGDVRSREAVEAAERYADVLATADELEAASSRAEAAYRAVEDTTIEQLAADVAVAVAAADPWQAAQASVEAAGIAAHVAVYGTTDSPYIPPGQANEGAYDYLLLESPDHLGLHLGQVFVAGVLVEHAVEIVLLAVQVVHGRELLLQRHDAVGRRDADLRGQFGSKHQRGQQRGRGGWNHVGHGVVFLHERDIGLWIRSGCIIDRGEREASGLRHQTTGRSGFTMHHLLLALAVLLLSGAAHHGPGRAGARKLFFHGPPQFGGIKATAWPTSRARLLAACR